MKSYVNNLLTNKSNQISIIFMFNKTGNVIENIKKNDDMDLQ